MIEEERKLNELLAKGRLDKYSDIIRIIINDIYKSGCLLYFREDEDIRSSHSRNADSCYIRISIKNNLYKYQEYIIWIMLHEFGHHFQRNSIEDLQDNSMLYFNEEKAWEFAEKKFNHYGFPEQLRANFIQCRNLYLNSYK